MDQTPNQSRHLSASTSSQMGTQSSPGLASRRFDGMCFPPQQRSEQRHLTQYVAESWVELSSQPSSSSLSSIGDEIVTTGLYVANPFQRRRRLRQPAPRSLPSRSTVINAPSSSSQELEEESESDVEDQPMSSSAEHVQHTAPAEPEASDEDSSDADDATALGRVTDTPTFRPQPNAFSHPPAFANSRRHSTNSSLPSHPHSEFRRPSFSQRSQTRVTRSGPSFMSPSLREDNDAALRASLTTLLSCAHAARGLPKTEEEAAARRAAASGVTPSSQPVELHLVAESELMNDDTNAAGTSRSQRRRGTPGTLSPKAKRSESAGRSPRAAKKKRTAVVGEDAMLISPTLLTWVVSAGVVVLVSVVGFGAGYVIGREVGRQEAQDVLAASMGTTVNETTTCGQEVMRSSGSGLRRLRWGAMGKSLVAQA